MKVKFTNPKFDEKTLLLKFNSRDCLAFGQVYELCFNEMMFFVNKLYKGANFEAKDVVQDIFISIWQTSNLKFENIKHIKGYIYASIRNKFKNHLTKQQGMERYNTMIANDDDTYVTEIIETEIYSFIQHSLKMLPKDCADIIKFHIEGWNIKEISDKLNISERSIFNKKKEAIGILKQNIKNQFVISLLGVIN